MVLCRMMTIIGSSLLCWEIAIKVAIEFKACNEVQKRHLNGLKAFKEEHPGCRLIVVSMDVNPRLLQEVEILPAAVFLQRLWRDEIISPDEII